MLAVKLILASGSPRRAEILAAAGIPFETHPTTVNESRLPNESPDAMVERLALAKARAAASALRMAQQAVVLGADTVVVVDDEVLGKPGTPQRACEMLLRLRGREHLVISGVALLRVTPGTTEAIGDSGAGHEITRVWFAPMTDEEVDEYVATGEPLDKAGGYAIQGRAGRFIPRIEGCYFNVVGLPLARVNQMLGDLGLVK
jgi:septum formation protein